MSQFLLIGSKGTNSTAQPPQKCAVSPPQRLFATLASYECIHLNNNTLLHTHTQLPERGHMQKQLFPVNPDQTQRQQRNVNVEAPGETFYYTERETIAGIPYNCTLTQGEIHEHMNMTTAQTEHLTT